MQNSPPLGCCGLFPGRYNPAAWELLGGCPVNVCSLSLLPKN